MRLFGNRALVLYLASFEYEMPELGSDDLVLGSGLCPWSPTVVLHVSLNSGVDDALMYLDSLRLPSRLKPSCRLTRDIQRHGTPLKFWAWSFGSIFLWKDMIVFVFWDL
ncbi:hypothetical protein M9H77_26968 [Catharanthus roseus]|uniref:Uncharacterized protein n=1 Tax=Catharanthus roseus TaxID=4058 RepID=A0ACC0AD28_CATRO|nr:hypothetical protein M9H77_26968 [Catharanthus roseus]